MCLTPETIAKLCFDKYGEMPKTGKPSATQWTVLAGVIQHNTLQNLSQVVALGLGTKCIGEKKMCRNGLIVNDSHAEVLARRGFIRYLYHQIREANKVKDGATSIMSWNAERRVYQIKDEYTFHFYSSYSPCGDACIIANAVEEIEGTRAKMRRISVEQTDNNIGAALDGIIVYTGGKLIDTDICVTGDRMAQTLGALRIKPGKGDRTLSMCCSDKLSKWCLLGIQGALIYNLLEKPIYCSSLNFGHRSDLNALQRALYKRWKDKGELFQYDVFKIYEPKIQICAVSVDFECVQTEDRKQSCPNGLVWCDIPEKCKSFEIIVNGKRQGCTKKVLKTKEASPQISKYKIFEEFVGILRENRDILDKCNLKDHDLTTLRYCDAKNRAKSYQDFWALLKTQHFGLWTNKPNNLQEFSLSTINKSIIMDSEK